MRELREQGLKYIDGQRAEARFRIGDGAIGIDELVLTARKADEMLRFTMEYMLGWQRMDYERCVRQRVCSMHVDSSVEPERGEQIRRRVRVRVRRGVLSGRFASIMVRVLSLVSFYLCAASSNDPG